MRVLSTSINFHQLTGMPKFIYTLGKELVKMGHEFVVTAPDIGEPMKSMAEKVGITVLPPEQVTGKFDAVFAQEARFFNLYKRFPVTPTYVYLHSKSEVDAPAHGPQVIEYLAPRLEVANHWINVCGAIDILEIPIDFEQFKPTPAKDDGRYKILVPCTLDNLRQPMLLNLIDRAKADPNILIHHFGDDHGALKTIELPENFIIHPSKIDIQEEMAWADEVAGIFVGTITLEAWAMGKKTSVYDEHGKWEFVEPYSNFEQKHDVREVAKEFIRRIS